MKRHIALFSWTLAVTLPFAAVIRPSLSEAQPSAKLPRIGYLGAGFAPTPTSPSSGFESFRKALTDLGYVEGQNIIIDSRWPEGGRADRLPGTAAELVSLKVDVICASGGIAARAAKSATTNIPIVFAVVVDPVGFDLVANRDRPGGNVTGFTTFDPQQARKQLGILKEALQGLARVAVLGQADISELLYKENEHHARALGLETKYITVQIPNPDLEGAVEAAKRERADALVILNHPGIGPNRRRIAELAAKQRLPTLFAGSVEDAGGLISYGTNLAATGQRMAIYVDKILKGTKPGDLPVEAVSSHVLIINLKTAREIGVTIPSEVLKWADQVIE